MRKRFFPFSFKICFCVTLYQRLEPKYEVQFRDLWKSGAHGNSKKSTGREFLFPINQSSTKENYFKKSKIQRRGNTIFVKRKIAIPWITKIGVKSVIGPQPQRQNCLRFSYFPRLQCGPMFQSLRKACAEG